MQTSAIDSTQSRIYLSKELIEKIPLELIKSIAETTTIVTSKGGAELLRTLDDIGKVTIELANKKTRGSRKKYPTNYTKPKKKRK